MPEFIGKFLTDRSFHVRVGSCLSDAFKQEIPVVTETKFLGLVFDRKLTFAAHIKYLKDRCLKALNLLLVVAHKDWGADSAALLKIY